VLQVNFRGSYGYGKAFLNAGNREWGGKMQNDLTDAVLWAIGQGIAAPDRVVIMGGSYGGYAALAGLAFTPQLYTAGIDLCGPSNLLTFLRNIGGSLTPQGARWVDAVGNYQTDEEFLRAHSPLFHAEQIRVPLLIGQGVNDPRVPQSESDQIVQALRQTGKPVQYFTYAGEGHMLSHKENRLHFFAQAEAFLAKYLNGRCEPVTPITGHTATEQ